MKYLTDKGVESQRLTAMGSGQDKPIANNNTNAGRQQIRRVELKILRQAK